LRPWVQVSILEKKLKIITILQNNLGTVLLLGTQIRGPGAVEHSYNPSYVGGKDWEDCGSSPVGQNVSD
jgi:hypothetical protein